MLLLLCLWVLVATPWMQQRAAEYAEHRLSKMLGTEVTVDGLRLGLLNRFSLTGVKINDRQGDTLVYVGDLRLAVTDWFPFKDIPRISYVRLDDALIKLQRWDTTWNHQFVLDIFAGGDTAASKSRPIGLQLDIVELNRVRFERLDHWRGRLLYSGVGHMNAKGRSFDLENGRVHLDKVNLDAPEYREFRIGGLWSDADSTEFWRRIDSMDALPRQPYIPDPDPFILTADKVDITNGNLRFFNRRTRPSIAGEFDERDIIITELQGNVRNFSLKGDTVNALVQLSAAERSGMRIASLSTRFTMHPQMMEFADLDLTTDR
ncbi:MAG TPA: hypothetical protein VK907_07765, partial [Phnomibacter sp.]|nr:hypothetical protein [Phnomibacter sp.]